MEMKNALKSHVEKKNSLKSLESIVNQLVAKVERALHEAMKIGAVSFLIKG